MTPPIAPLAGLRVLDLSRVLAGPLCAQTLGDLGAEIIKVEACGMGDDSRAWPPFRHGVSTAFLAVNRHKKSLALDLKQPAGVAILRRMVRECDVVIESNAPGVAERLGIGPAALQAENPRLVYCSISGFGPRGPLAGARGYDVILQAFCGMMGLTGEENSGPVRIPFSPIDQSTGHHAVIGILAALMQRGRTGQGGLVQASLFETAVAFMGYLLQAFWEEGSQPARAGSGHGSIVPYQAFACVDKPILLGIANDKLFRAFCEAFELGAVIEDERFASNAARTANRQDTIAIVQGCIGHWRAAELAEKMHEIGIPCSPINSLEDLLKHEHTIASGIIGRVTDHTLGGFQAVGLPVTFDGQRPAAGSAAPLLGEHTRAVLLSFGYTPAEVAAFCEAGVVQSALPA